jgi:hypothetical protein
LYGVVRSWVRRKVGSLANAASSGANTVNGPGPFKVASRPVAESAEASVPNWPAATAVSTMFFVSGCGLVPGFESPHPPASALARSREERSGKRVVMIFS